LEKTETTLQKEKAQLLEQYKQVKKLERQGKRREARIENIQQQFQQQANEHFSIVYTTLQLGLKAQPSPQSPPVVCQADVNIKSICTAFHFFPGTPSSLSTAPPRIVGISSTSTATFDINANVKNTRLAFQTSCILIDVWKTPLGPGCYRVPSTNQELYDIPCTPALVSLEGRKGD
jgi:hypothetical protein